VLLVDGKISQFQQVFGILDFCAKQTKPLIVIAEDVESEALAGFIVNKLRGGLKVCSQGREGGRRAGGKERALVHSWEWERGSVYERAWGGAGGGGGER
jgi:chaperonin GroEL (HSP60 family)